MSVRKHHIALSGPPPRIEIGNPAGSVTVEAVEGADMLDVRVEPLDAAAEELLERVEIDVSDTDPDRTGSPVRLRIAVPERQLLRTPHFAVRITTPVGTAARVVVASADVELRGRFAGIEMSGASGDLAVDEAAELELRTASGDVRVRSVHGGAFVKSASGDVTIGHVAGALHVRGASGNVSVERASDAHIRTASGDVTVGTAAGEIVQVATSSGDVSVGVVPGLRVWLQLHTVSGRMASELDDDSSDARADPDLTVTLESVSGDIRVGRAAPALVD
jgi:hypothetical protein